MTSDPVLLLPGFDAPQLVAASEPFIVFEISGKPGHKARHRSRLVFPKTVWRHIPGFPFPVMFKEDQNKVFVQQYADPGTEAYEKVLQLAGRTYMARAGHREPTHNPVALLVHVFKSIPASWSERDKRLARTGGILPTTKPDWDNHGKVTDALNGIVWHDDSQVVDGRVVKRYSDEPGLRVEVREFVTELRLAKP